MPFSWSFKTVALFRIHFSNSLNNEGTFLQQSPLLGWGDMNSDNECSIRQQFSSIPVWSLNNHFPECYTQFRITESWPYNFNGKPQDEQTILKECTPSIHRCPTSNRKSHFRTFLVLCLSFFKFSRMRLWFIASKCCTIFLFNTA